MYLIKRMIKIFFFNIFLNIIILLVLQNFFNQFYQFYFFRFKIYAFSHCCYEWSFLVAFLLVFFHNESIVGEGDLLFRNFVKKISFILINLTFIVTFGLLFNYFRALLPFLLAIGCRFGVALFKISYLIVLIGLQTLSFGIKVAFFLFFRILVDKLITN